ncbi:MAG: nucleotide-binding universal stress UspA family protein [Flavobacteriales bacterium]|jgi:nucleotide-binding universal stress UspA family protein
MRMSSSLSHFTRGETFEDLNAIIRQGFNACTPLNNHKTQLMRSILVPTDFSKYAYYAAEVAASIAKKTGARVYLLHAIEIPTYSANDSFGEGANTAEGLFMLKRAKMEFEKLIQQPFFNEVNVIEILQWENVYDIISDKAQEHEIDLIVMGSQGASGAKEFFIGSNTEKIIRTAHCPVLTVKEKMEKFEPKDVVFASNFYGVASAVFAPLMNLLDLFGAKVHLLKVITPAEFETTDYTEKLMADFIAKTGVKNYTTNIWNDTMAEDGIHEFADRIGADMISMETHGRTGLAHFFRQSLTEDVANHSHLPILSQRIELPKKKRGAIFPD